VREWEEVQEMLLEVINPTMTAPHPINTRNASDRMFCFLTMLTLGKTKRVHMERAVERYADGADAVIRDAQREKSRKREWM